MIEVKIPDIGDFDEVEVIEVLVSVGDTVAIEDPIVTLESDKATMEIPSPAEGTISSIEVAIGDKVAEGAVIAQVNSEDSDETVDKPGDESNDQSGDQSGDDPSNESNDNPGNDTGNHAVEDEVEIVSAETNTSEEPADEKPQAIKAPPKDQSAETISKPAALPHASPAIRRFARELGADLVLIAGSGPKGRILKEDVKNWVKTQLSANSHGNSTESHGAQSMQGIPAIPEVDFTEFGETENLKLSRIKKLSGPHLQRAWLNIPHVTHHDEADITDLEAFRKSLKAEAQSEGLRITLLSFVMKVLVGALKKYPNFNASLAPNGEELILKKYFNIGIAVDTPNGLVVPVVRDVDRKSIFDLARDLGGISERARDGKLKPDDLKGGCISISSLGGIGGTAFTPIVNAPEVAILGIARSKMSPVWDGEAFVPRLMLPLDLSYDHRVVDGAEAARFVAYLTQSFADVRRLSL